MELDGFFRRPKLRLDGGDPVGLAVKRLRAATAVLTGSLAAWVLWRFPPKEYSFYPVCPFHAATGLLGPGCGATRALAALLHGRLSLAFTDNALVVMLLPMTVVYLSVALGRQWRGKTDVWPPLGRFETAALLLLAVGFAIWRNLLPGVSPV